MKEKLKKIVNIDFCAICIFCIVLLSNVFNVKFGAVDELWNFSDIYKMYSGYNIYKDINIITTPLFWYIGKLIFDIFEPNYFVFRIYNFMIYFSLFYIIYSIFKNLKMKKISSIIYTLIIYMFVYRTIGAGANYNCLAVVFYLLGILIILKTDLNKWYSPYLQGIMTFIIFFTKQNIGVYYLIASLIMSIMIAFNNRNIKKEIIFFIKQTITFFILCFIFLLILVMQNNIDSFINMCVLGITEFACNNISGTIFAITMLTVTIISVVMSIIIIKLKNTDNKIKVNNIKILPFAIMCFFISFPIFNRYHVYLSSILGIILLIYNLDKLIVVELIDIKKIKRIYIAIIVIIVIYNAVCLILNNSKYYKSLNTYINPYYGSMISNEQINNINNICEFIKQNEQEGIDVKIISYTSNLYMNVLNKNNGILDLPFYGNLGKDGDQGIINIISSISNVKILIQKNDDLFFQESQKVRDYIKQNLEYEGEIEDFLIYSK